MAKQNACAISLQAQTSGTAQLSHTTAATLHEQNPSVHHRALHASMQLKSPVFKLRSAPSFCTDKGRSASTDACKHLQGWLGHVRTAGPIPAHPSLCRKPDTALPPAVSSWLPMLLRDPPNKSCCCAAPADSSLTCGSADTKLSAEPNYGSRLCSLKGFCRSKEARHAQYCGRGILQLCTGSVLLHSLVALF